MKDLLKRKYQLRYPPEVEAVIKEEADRGKVTVAAILSRDRKKPVAQARQMVMYRLREEYDYAFKTIGFYLSRDHSSVIYGVERARQLVGGG